MGQGSCVGAARMFGMLMPSMAEPLYSMAEANDIWLVFRAGPDVQMQNVTTRDFTPVTQRTRECDDHVRCLGKIVLTPNGAEPV